MPESEPLYAPTENKEPQLLLEVNEVELVIKKRTGNEAGLGGPISGRLLQ